MPSKADSPTMICTKDGCTKHLRARGLCGTHYNQAHQPNQHAKKLMPCAYCGTEVLKAASRTNRYDHIYCSLQCRDWDRLGYSKLPADHWARWYGNACKWTPPKIERQSEDKDCRWCGARFTTIKPLQVMCSKRCMHKAGRARRRAAEQNAKGTYTWAEVTRLWISIDRSCAYCDQAVTVYEPDHVVPLSKGGSNSITNIVPACPLCNSDKRDLSLAAWYEDRQRRKLPARHLTPRLTHLTHALLAAA